jgi:Ca2+-binding EF-hand superfamily protein
MEFQKIVLDFQLKSHDKFLKNLIFIFKRFDSDNNGIISEDEFINLIHTLNIYKDDLNEQIKRILTVIDPFNKKIITFSECVSLFSMEFIYDDDGNGGKRKLSVLERVSLDEALLNA